MLSWLRLQNSDFFPSRFFPFSASLQTFRLTVHFLDQTKMRNVLQSKLQTTLQILLVKNNERTYSVFTKSLSSVTVG